MVNKEVGIDLMERHDAVCQALRKAPDSFSAFAEQVRNTMLARLHLDETF